MEFDYFSGEERKWAVGAAGALAVGAAAVKGFLILRDLRNRSEDHRLHLHDAVQRLRHREAEVVEQSTSV